MSLYFGLFSVAACLWATFCYDWALFNSDRPVTLNPLSVSVRCAMLRSLLLNKRKLDSFSQVHYTDDSPTARVRRPRSTFAAQNKGQKKKATFMLDVQG